MRVWALIVMVWACSGCVLFSYELTPPREKTISLQKGESCGMIFLGLGGGKLSVAEAMKRGGITTPKTIKVTMEYILLAGQNCIIVEGE
jgi:hypothetical protein